MVQCIFKMAAGIQNGEKKILGKESKMANGIDKKIEGWRLEKNMAGGVQDGKGKMAHF